MGPVQYDHLCTNIEQQREHKSAEPQQYWGEPLLLCK